MNVTVDVSAPAAWPVGTVIWMSMRAKSFESVKFRLHNAGCEELNGMVNQVDPLVAPHKRE